MPQDEQHDDAGPHADGGEERAEEEDPVRAQLGQQLLVLVEELPRQGHRGQRTGGRSPAPGHGRRRVS